MPLSRSEADPTGLPLAPMPDASVHHRRPSVWSRLIRDSGGVVGLVIVILVLLIAAIGPFLAPYGVAQSDLTNRLAGPSAAHLLGLTSWDKTSSAESSSARE